MADDPKAVLARLTPLQPQQLKHPVKLRDLRTTWNHAGCASTLQDAKLSSEQKIKVTMDWLAKAGVRDFVLGKLVLAFARPLPPAPTEEKKKERRHKRLAAAAYHDDIPHLRAVNKVVTARLEGVPGDTALSLAELDKRDDREIEKPGTMFIEFAKSIDEQAALEYSSSKPGESPFQDAAE